MVEALAHRGPSDSGEWVDVHSRVALGHSRLAILDLSSAGHQPMLSASKRYVIVFNGEIYNHLELRKTLNGVDWRGHSDTETLLAAFDAWGVEETLKKAVGMFALALWDRKAQVLTLARDRMGEKPLYYGWVGESLVFASELKGIRAFPGFAKSIDRQALAQYMRFAYVPNPWSIYEGIYKMPPGNFVQFKANPRNKLSSHMAEGNRKVYWSLREVAEKGQADPFDGGERDAIAELETRLAAGVRSQMLADVPFGAFLSGGIDSSVVVALMQTQSSRPVQTFTIGFHETGYNEAEYAHSVAGHLGTEHTELFVTSNQAMAVIPKLPALYDEPFADSSQIPTFLVSQLARRHVTVALSGDGGDELFGGYNRYFLASRIWQRLRFLPPPARQLVIRLIRSMPPSTWNKVASKIGHILPKHLAFMLAGDKLHKVAGMLEEGGMESMYRYLVSFWQNETVVLGVNQPITHIDDIDQWPDIAGNEHRMMCMDAMTYLPDDILVKVDRAAMGVSLETRVPMLDHRVVELAWKLPLHMKIRGSQGKWVLRQVLYKYVPREIIDRPKMGFGVPLDVWLRGPLREWAEDLLSEDRLRREGYFNIALIREKWLEHLAGRRNWAYHLWNVLTFEQWKEFQ